MSDNKTIRNGPICTYQRVSTSITVFFGQLVTRRDIRERLSINPIERTPLKSILTVSRFYRIMRDWQNYESTRRATLVNNPRKY